MEGIATCPHAVLARSISHRAARTLPVFLLATELIGCRQSPREPVTLRYPHSWLSRPDDITRMAVLSQQFTQDTGIRITNIPTPESTHDYLELSRKLLREGGSGVDLLNIDLIWSPLLEPDLIDLRPDLAAEIALIEPQLLPSYMANGKLVAVPSYVTIGGLEYRKDLLREHGYDHPPKTWDELEIMAKRIQAGERAKGKKDFWGYVWQGTAAEALTCNALEWQAAEGAGRIIENDRTISVNNPATIRAWERAKRWIGSISPPAVVSYRERDSMSVFDSGRAAFDRIWLVTPISKSAQAREIRWRSSVPVVETGFASMPGGPGGSAGTLGGSGVAVSVHSVHRQEAITLVRFLIRAQIQSGEKEGAAGGLPGQPGFDDSSSIADVHADPNGTDQRASGIVARPSVVSAGTYEKVTRAYFGAVHSVLTGEKKASQAAAELEKQLIEITGFDARPKVAP